MDELRFNFKAVTVGQAKTFKRLCGKDYMTYRWGEIVTAPVEEHAAFYYLVQSQNDPSFSEDRLDTVTVQEIEDMYDALTAALENPQTGSETNS